MLFARAPWLRKWYGVAGPLSERPIIYEVLNPALDHGATKSVFVEVEMKDGLGFYSGQLSQFAIVKEMRNHTSQSFLSMSGSRKSVATTMNRWRRTAS